MHMVTPSPVLRGATSNARPRIPHSFVANPSTGSEGRRASSVTGSGEGGKTSRAVLRTKQQNSVIRRDGSVFLAASHSTVPHVGQTETVSLGGVQWRRARTLRRQLRQLCLSVMKCIRSTPDWARGLSRLIRQCVLGSASGVLIFSSFLSYSKISPVCD